MKKHFKLKLNVTGKDKWNDKQYGELFQFSSEKKKGMAMGMEDYSLSSDTREDKSE